MGKNTKNIVLVAALAAGVGYLAGVLTAPKSGKETRQDIKVNAINKKKELEEKLKYLSEESSKIIAKAQNNLLTLKGRASVELSAALSRANDAKEKARGVLSAFHEGEADDDDLNAAVKELNSSIANLKKYISKTKA